MRKHVGFLGACLASVVGLVALILTAPALAWAWRAVAGALERAGG